MSFITINRIILEIIVLILLFCLLTIPVSARTSIGLDLASGIRALEADRVTGATPFPGGGAQGGDNNTEATFRNGVGNLHIRSELTNQINTYVELWLKQDNNVTLNEARVVMSDAIRGIDLKIGKFVIDYGIQHYHRSDFGEVQDNPLIGNSLVDPIADQMGIEFSSEYQDFEWLVGVTAGNDTAVVSTNNEPAYMTKLGYQFTPSLNGSFSFYIRDASVDSATLAHATNLFTWNGGEIYQLPTNNTHVTLGDGGDVTAGQIDFEYVFLEGAELRGWYGRFEDKVEPGGSGVTQKAEYAGIESMADLTPSFYAAGRYERVKDETSGLSGDDDVNRWQIGFGYRASRNTLMKIEWVEQNADNFNGNGSNGAVNVAPQDFDGLSAELSVSM